MIGGAGKRGKRAKIEKRKQPTMRRVSRM